MSGAAWSHPDLTAVLPGHADVADPLRLEAVAGEGGADGGGPGEAPGRERLPGGRGHPPGDQVLRPPRLHQLTRDSYNKGTRTDTGKVHRVM